MARRKPHTSVRLKANGETAEKERRMNGGAPKRLVGWKQYLRHRGATWTGNVSGTVLVLGGVAGLLLSVLTMLASIAGMWFGILLGLVLGGISGFSFYAGVTILRKVDSMQPVTLLTKQNAKYLPEVKTLVRGSDPPITAPQTELLRATTQEQETPAEQLLRAGPGSGQDV